MNAARQPSRIFHARGLALGVLLSLSITGAAADWPQFRGANHDGISTDRLNRQWTGAVTNPVWRVVLTNCLGSLVVSRGLVFTQTRRFANDGDRELCVALDAATGAEIWATPVDTADYPDGGVGYDDGPRSTPTVDGDSVFVLSSYLKLWRLNITNGAPIWQADLVNLYGAELIPWQNAASPLVENGLVYLNGNCPTSRVVAVRVEDGSLAWRCQDEAMTHSTAILATLSGVRQLILATQSGLLALDPRTGDRLWRLAYPFNYGTSIGASPVVWEDMIFIGGAHSYLMGSMVARASFSNGTWTATRLWFTNNPATHWMTPVARDGFLFGQFGIQSFDSVNAQLKCVDMRTGAVKWSTNNFGRGATVLFDNHVVALTERGQVVLIEPSTNSYVELARFTAIPDYADFTNKCWNAPAVADGRLYVRSTAFVACFDLSVPGLKLETVRPESAGGLDLSIRTVTGVPVASNRVAALEIRATTNLALSLTQWTRLTNSLVITGNMVRVPNVAGSGETGKFFIVNEPY